MDIVETLARGLRTASAEVTQATAQALAAVVPTDRVLALQGDLGVGKTTFVRGLARAWGIEGHITSPSFSVYQIHAGKTRQLAHLDAYRLKGPADFEALLLDEFLQSPWCLAVEWPENVAAALPSDTAWIELSIIDESAHWLRLKNPEVLR